MAKWDLSKLPEGRKPLPDEWFMERAQMQERIEELEAKLESVYEESKKTLGSIYIPERIKNFIDIEKYSYSTPVMTFLLEVSPSKMMKFPNIGKKSIEEFSIEVEKVVGKKAVQLWLRGRSPDGGCGDLLKRLKDSTRKSYRLEAVEYIEELESKLAKAEDFCLRLERFANQSGHNFLLKKARDALAELKGEKDA